MCQITKEQADLIHMFETDHIEHVLIENLPEKAYHKLEYVSFSRLKKILTSVRDYYIPTDFRITPQMLEGTMIHKWVLERSTFWDSYIATSQIEIKSEELNAFRSAVPKNKTTGKKELPNDMIRFNPMVRSHNKWLTRLGREGVSEEQIDMLMRIDKSIIDNDDVSSLLNSMTQTEVTILWKYKGVKVKSRIDSVFDNGEKIGDIKTVGGYDCLNERKIKWAVNDYRYIMQAYMYKLAYEKATKKEVSNTFEYIYIDRGGINNIRRATMGLESLRAGEKMFKEAINTLQNTEYGIINKNDGLPSIFI